jgi:hypothetical protein
MSPTPTQPDPNDDLQAELNKALDRADKQFRVDYAEAMASLKELSPQEIAKLTPTLTEKEAYKKLIQAVEIATRRNESQAALQARLKALGEVSYALAQRVAGLAKYLK